MAFFLRYLTVSAHLGALITYVFCPGQYCVAWWIGGGSGKIFCDVKIKTLLSDANSTIGHHFCILNHKRLY